MQTRSWIDPLVGIGSSGIGARLLILVLLALTVICFILSMTAHYGRSRWPLHALIGTGIFAIGAAVLALVNALWNGLPDLVAAGSAVPSGIFSTASWLAVIGTLAGLLAAVRALIGMVREPGPRF